MHERSEIPTYSFAQCYHINSSLTSIFRLSLILCFPILTVFTSHEPFELKSRIAEILNVGFGFDDGQNTKLALGIEFMVRRQPQLLHQITGVIITLGLDRNHSLGV